MNDDGGKFTEEEPGSLKPGDITKKIIKDLTAREAKVSRDGFGLDLQKNVDLEEPGKQFNITRERIKEIELKALKKLKNRKISGEIKCSFCGMGKSEVNKLIASELSTSYICGRCIKICMDLLDD